MDMSLVYILCMHVLVLLVTSRGLIQSLHVCDKETSWQMYPLLQLPLGRKLFRYCKVQHTVMILVYCPVHPRACEVVHLEELISDLCNCIQLLCLPSMISALHLVLTYHHLEASKVVCAQRGLIFRGQCGPMFQCSRRHFERCCLRLKVLLVS